MYVYAVPIYLFIIIYYYFNSVYSSYCTNKRIQKKTFIIYIYFHCIVQSKKFYDI